MTLAAFKAVCPGGRAVGGWVRFPHASASVPPPVREGSSLASPAGEIEIDLVRSLALRSPRPAGAVQALYTALLLAGIGTSGLLRTFHDHTPRLFTGPLGSLLAIGTFALLALHLVQRRDGRDLFPEAPAHRGLRPGLAIPLLAVLLSEKWISVDVLGSAYRWIDATFQDPEAADAMYRTWTALALLGVSFGALWVLRQSAHRLARLAEGRRLLFALSTAAGATLLTAAGLWALARFAGGNPAWQPAPQPLLLIGGAQLFRAVAEEFFFRGVVQTGLVRLLAETGLGEGRLPRLLAIAAVSSGFALEHYDPSLGPGTNLRTLLYVFAMSSVFGAMLEVARNLYLPMAAHAVVNLLVSGVWPIPLAGDGTALVTPNFAATCWLVLVFGVIVIGHHRRGFA